MEARPDIELRNKLYVRMKLFGHWKCMNHHHFWAYENLRLLSESGISCSSVILQWLDYCNSLRIYSIWWIFGGMVFRKSPFHSQFISSHFILRWSYSNSLSRLFTACFGNRHFILLNGTLLYVHGRLCTLVGITQWYLDCDRLKYTEISTQRAARFEV